MSRPFSTAILLFAILVLVPPASQAVDVDVDQADFGHLQACLSGAGVMYGPGCQDADLVVDNAIDGADLGWFLSCLNGAGQPPGC